MDRDRDVDAEHDLKNMKELEKGEQDSGRYFGLFQKILFSYC
jgi:hypothetical protein